MTTIPKKTISNLLSNFKKSNNPLYQPNFGISLSKISHWTKEPQHNYIIVVVDGLKYLYVGTTARTILYSVGDKDYNKFQELTPEEETILSRQLTNPTPPPAPTEHEQTLEKVNA